MQLLLFVGHVSDGVLGFVNVFRTWALRLVLSEKGSVVRQFVELFGMFSNLGRVLRLSYLPYFGFDILVPHRHAFLQFDRVHWLLKAFCLRKGGNIARI